MKDNIINGYKLAPAELINQAMGELPTAEAHNLTADVHGTPDKVPNFRTIRSINKDGTYSYVSCPTPKYAVVNHNTAFRKVVEGMTLAGVKDFRFSLSYNEKYAKMNVFLGHKAVDSVEVGFSAVNSYDGSNMLVYGIDLNAKTQMVELVGYRQVCSNGMKIRVPLNEAEIVREEVRTKVKEILKTQARLVHTDGIHAKMESVQYVVEAVSLLVPSIVAMIERAQDWKIEDTTMLKELIKEHVGKRWGNKVMAAYEKEETADLWALYNAMTNVASHSSDFSFTARERLLDKAAVMLAVVPRKKA